MFIFGFRGYNKGKKLNKNKNSDKIILSDYVLFIANIVILLVLITCIVIKCYDVLIEHHADNKNILYLEIMQFIIFVLTIIFSCIYCIKESKKPVIISRCLFLSNILFNLVILFAFDLISKLQFEIFYNQIINNIVNLIVIIFIAIDCIISNIKITRENSKTLKK